MYSRQGNLLQKTNGYSILSCLLVLMLTGMLCIGFIRLYQTHTQMSIKSNFDSFTYQPMFSWIFFNNHTQALGFYPFESIAMKPYQTVAPLFAPQSTLIKMNDLGPSGSDSFILNYQGNDSGNVFNCQGTPLMANQQTESLYYINAQHDLVCTTWGENSSANEKAYPIMKNVECMVIRLGEDLDKDGLVNRYIPPNSLSTSYDRIINIRVSLLLRTDEISEQLTPNQYYNLDGEEKGPYPDLYVRKVLTTTIPLKRKTHP